MIIFGLNQRLSCGRRQFRLTAGYQSAPTQKTESNCLQINRLSHKSSLYRASRIENFDGSFFSSTLRSVNLPSRSLTGHSLIYSC